MIFIKKDSFSFIKPLILTQKRKMLRIFQPGGSASSVVSFTLIELLIVIGIIAILSAAVVITINPAERLREARDSTRVTDITTLDNTIRISQTQNTALSLGTASTVYISIPDSSTSCANLGLPSLPSGWSYNCASTSTYRNTDGTGWVPVNFQDGSLYGIAQLSALPIDPTNTTSTGLYYTYTPGGSYKLSIVFESIKYQPLEASDGGSNIAAFEKGTDLALAPFVGGMIGYWKFDGDFTDSSGYGYDGLIGGGSVTFVSGYKDQAASFSSSYLTVGDRDVTKPFTFTLWINKNVGSAGDQSMFLKSGSFYYRLRNGAYPSIYISGSDARYVDANSTIPGGGLVFCCGYS